MVRGKWYLMELGQHMTILVLGQYKLVLLDISGTGSAKGSYACIYWKKLRFGRVLPLRDRLTHRQHNIELLGVYKVLSLS